MQTLLNSRPLLWALLAAPGAWWLWRYATEAMSYGEVVHATGDLAAQLLLVTLAVTPARLLFRRQRWPAWWVRRRRDLGVATFGYAALHTVVYLVRKADAARILAEGAQPDLLTGWMALVLFAALAATSNDVSVRWLGAAWRRLHLLVHLGAVLTFVHWVLTAFDPLTAFIHLVVLAALETVRIARWAQSRTT